MENVDEPRWVERLLDRDPEAEAAFVARYYDDLYRFLRHLTRHVQESEDLAQQTLVRAFRNLRSYDRRSSLRTWLHRIAFREYLNWRRARRFFVALSPLHADRSNAIDGVLDAEMLLAAIHRLPSKSAAAFLLVEVQELSHAEAAEVLGCPVGTVKSRLHEAKARLRELLGEPMGDTRYEPKPCEH